MGTDVVGLEGRFRTRDGLVGIVGMGYVGLPLMLAAAGAGFRVLGFDVDEPKVGALNHGKSPLKHVGDGRIAAVRERDLFEATADFGRLGEPDAILICVPTPLGPHREPDLSYVEATARSIAAALRPGQLVVLESTTWPGTTRQVVKPILEATSLRSGEDFFLAFSPEREDPGNLDFETSRIPKVVGGDDAAALGLACALYDQFVIRTVPVSSADTAEAVKLTENIFRAVNIALVNELKIIYWTMGIDVLEVIEAAGTKPFGFMPFYPGPGLGGHCIPIDPFYLTWKAREFDITTRFIELAGQINAAMPQYVISRLADELDRRFSKGLNGSRILVLGVAYKKNVDDMRESPTLKLMQLLEGRRARVDYFDPHIPQIPKTREHPEFAGRTSIAFDAPALAQYDAALISTDHDSIDYKMLVDGSRLVIDTRNACERFGVKSEKVAKA